MKKLFMTVLTVAAVSGCLQGLPVGNPGDASMLIDGILWEGQSCDPCDPCASWCDAVSVRFGFYGDYVIDRMMTVDNAPSTMWDANVGQTIMNTNSAYLAINFWDRFDVFGSLGKTTTSIITGGSVFQLSNAYATPVPSTVTTLFNSTIRLNSTDEFSWSVGARGSLWECGCATLGAEFQFAQSKPDWSEIRSTNHTNPFWIKSASRPMTYREWQAGLGLSYRINMLTPFVAVKWSRPEIKSGSIVITESGKTGPDLTLGSAVLTGVGFTVPDLVAQNQWGFAFGATLVDADKVSVTVEGRIGDERAVSVNSQLRF
nr:porin [Candidatus Clavichlamydia salmonicola]